MTDDQQDKLATFLYHNAPEAPPAPAHFAALIERQLSGDSTSQSRYSPAARRAPQFAALVAAAAILALGVTISITEKPLPSSNTAEITAAEVLIEANVELDEPLDNEELYDAWSDLAAAVAQN